MVAENFEKEHKHVLRDIDNLKKDVPNFGLMFYETELPDAYGRLQRAYYITKKGFQLLAMGFTGKKAIEWKLRYIDAFEAMEKHLAVPKLTPNPHYRSRMIKTAVKDIGGTADAIAEVFGVKKGMATAAAMTMIGEAYGIDTEPLRQLLPAEAKPSYLTPTAIGEALGGVKAKDVNIMLMNLGLQEKTAKGWQLTTIGKEYGESVPYNRNGHSGYQIQWGPGVIGLLK
jgi:Rha family phage regulatory protein